MVVLRRHRADTGKFLIMIEQILYRTAKSVDLPKIAGVFLAAFPESVRHYSRRQINPSIIEDIFGICLDSEPDAFFVAELNHTVVGYIFAPAHFSRLTRVAILHGHIFRMFGRWIIGRYHIGLRPVIIAARNWWYLISETKHEIPHTDERILSIAVHPSFQGYGIATGLLAHGLRYLRSSGAKSVRLEVRPDNSSAVRVYRKYGFTPEGYTSDTQGSWLIMLKDMSNEAQL